MNNGIKVERKFHVQRGRRRVAPVNAGNAKPVFENRIPRISRLMALAIRFDQLIMAGAVRDQVELAKLGRVSRARVSQIMNLFHLAPDIQAWLLESISMQHGRDTISERQLRPVAAQASWRKQRQLLSRLLARCN